MPKHVVIYLSDDDARILDMCEASGLIRNRSDWVRKNLIDFAMKHGIAQAFDQELQKVEARASSLKKMREEQVKVEIDVQLIWERIVKQFCARGTRPSHHQDVDWLKPRKSELKICRPGKSLDEVLDELIDRRNNL